MKLMDKFRKLILSPDELTFVDEFLNELNSKELSADERDLAGRITELKSIPEKSLLNLIKWCDGENSSNLLAQLALKNIAEQKPEWLICVEQHLREGCSNDMVAYCFEIYLNYHNFTKLISQLSPVKDINKVMQTLEVAANECYSKGFVNAYWHLACFSEHTGNHEATIRYYKGVPKNSVLYDEACDRIHSLSSKEVASTTTQFALYIENHSVNTVTEQNEYFEQDSTKKLFHTKFYDA